jgi:hypothetical protein
MPFSPEAFEHKTHPSSYSATTLTTSPTWIGSSSGKVGINVLLTVAALGIDDAVVVVGVPMFE